MGMEEEKEFDKWYQKNDIGRASAQVCSHGENAPYW